MWLYKDQNLTLLFMVIFKVHIYLIDYELGKKKPPCQFMLVMLCYLQNGTWLANSGFMVFIVFF